MLVKQLNVQNFRSLKQLQLELGQYNFLIGKNNSGKSNILDCLNLISELSSGVPVHDVINSKGGYSRVVFGGEESLEIQLELDLIHEAREYRYSLKLDKHSIAQEELIAMPHGERLLYRAERSSTTQLSSAKPGTHPLDAILIKNFLTSWSFHAFQPAKMRTQLHVKQDYQISREGENLCLVLHNMLANYTEDFFRLESQLKQLIPEIKWLRSPLTPDGRTYIALEEFVQGKLCKFDHLQLSDGTLWILAHLAAINSPRKPGLIGIEHPEDFVHPKLLGDLVALIKNSGIQVVATTHSPYLVSELDPQDVIAVIKQDGVTRAERLPAQKLREFLSELSLGEIWYSGELGNV